MKASEALEHKQYRCGHCGEKKHELFKLDGDIIVQCCGCDNESKITLHSDVKLDIKWVDGNDGLLAVF